MDRPTYGLPPTQNRFLDSPYGLAPTPEPVASFPPPLPEPVRDWRGPTPVPQPQPQPVPGPAWASQPQGQPAPPPWATRPQQPHQTPYILPQGQDGVVDSNTGAGGFPTIGKNVSLGAFTDLQRKAESSGNYQALNKEKAGNTASGAYQYTDATWNNYGGYPKALLAPKAVQDRRFAEDLSKRASKYNGDMFKAMAEHYLPAYANTPERWSSPSTFKHNGKTVTTRSVESYLRHVLKGSPYANQLDRYLEQHG